jgi:hypothetical protein
MNDKQKKALEGYNHFISLRSHNVELGIIDELKASKAEVSARLEAGIKSAASFESKFKDLKDQLNKESLYMEKIYLESRKKLYDAETKVKELGIALPKDWLTTLEEIRKSVSKMPKSNLQNIFP